jgi:hypothetical protein
VTVAGVVGRGGFNSGGERGERGCVQGYRRYKRPLLRRNQRQWGSIPKTVDDSD